VAAFQAAYGAKFGKAAAKITDDVDELLAFYDFPAEHKLIQSAQSPLARGERTPPRRPCPRRRPLRQRQTRRTTRRPSPTISRLKDLDPQVLTHSLGDVAPYRGGYGYRGEDDCVDGEQESTGPLGNVGGAGQAGESLAGGERQPRLEVADEFSD
jgi:hypothetical protein